MAQRCCTFVISTDDDFLFVSSMSNFGRNYYDRWLRTRSALTIISSYSLQQAGCDFGRGDGGDDED